MKTNVFLVVALWSLGLNFVVPACAEEKFVPSADIALQGGGLLIGQVVNAAGQPLVGAPVVLTANGQEIARCQTDKTGTFRVAGLKGGAIEVASVGAVGTCRLWAPNTAPPAAQQGLLVIANEDIVRGQHCGSQVDCGSCVGGGYGSGRGHGGGLLGLMIDHPLITAGAVGAAIAIPIAVSNDDSPSSP